MRGALIAAALLLAPQAYAATEPERFIPQDQKGSDPRIVKAMYVEGSPVIIRGKIGQALRVIFKGPWRIQEVMPSDQALMSGIAPPLAEGRRGHSDGAPDEGGGSLQDPTRPPQSILDQGTGCESTRTLTICKTLGYMLTLTATIAQNEQPLLVVMKLNGSRSEVYMNVDFLFSTVEAEQSPAPPPIEPDGGDMLRRLASASGQDTPPAPQHVQTLHLTLNPPEMPRPAPTVAAQPVRRYPPRVAPLPAVTEPARPLSRPYGVVGDAALIGGGR